MDGDQDVEQSKRISGFKKSNKINDGRLAGILETIEGDGACVRGRIS